MSVLLYFIKLEYKRGCNEHVQVHFDTTPFHSYKLNRNRDIKKYHYTWENMRKEIYIGI